MHLSGKLDPDEIIGDIVRRRFFQSIGVSAVSCYPLTSSIACDVLSRDLQNRNLMAMGIASGSPSANGFVLWTRLLGLDPDNSSPVPVYWEVQLGRKAGGMVVSQGETSALAQWGYSVHVELSGLPSGQWYRYRFIVGEEVSEWGFTRTLPAANDDVKLLRLAYASCQRWEDGFYAGYRHMLAENVDIVVFLGDYIYELRSRRSCEAVRTHDLPYARSLRDYRDRYALYRSDPDLQRMHASCPWLVTWDDHETENNYAGLLSTNGKVDFMKKRLAAYQAFYENMPIRKDAWKLGLFGGDVRLHVGYDFGNLARIHVLDNRQFRDKPACGSRPSDYLAKVCTNELREERSMLGLEQEKWLLQSLSESALQKKRWNFLCQQTRFSPKNFKAGFSHKYSSDTWDGYPHARQRLINDLLSSNANNPVILGGDIHQNWVANVHKDSYDIKSPVVASEFCGTSISSRSGLSFTSVQRSQLENPHCLYAENRWRGYGIINLEPSELNVKLRVIDNVENPNASVRTQAHFKVEAGSPEVHKC